MNVSLDLGFIYIDDFFLIELKFSNKIFSTKGYIFYSQHQNFAWFYEIFLKIFLSLVATEYLISIIFLCKILSAINLGFW